MMKTIQTMAILFLAFSLQGQQLFIEGFGAMNRTNYDATAFSSTAGYFAGGARVAFGADHVQVGGEYRTNITHPEFGSGAVTSFEETYYGALIRAKISRYPAMRFGLVLKAGAGLYNTTARWDSGLTEISADYDQILGYNGGVGISIPAFKAVMLELGYAYNYVQRPTLESAGLPLIEKHNGSYHSLQAGLSLNFVFGERARQYQHLKDNWKWRNGWRT